MLPARLLPSVQGFRLVSALFAVTLFLLQGSIHVILELVHCWTNALSVSCGTSAGLQVASTFSPWGPHGTLLGTHSLLCCCCITLDSLLYEAPLHAVHSSYIWMYHTAKAGMQFQLVYLPTTAALPAICAELYTSSMLRSHCTDSDKDMITAYTLPGCETSDIAVRYAEVL